MFLVHPLGVDEVEVDRIPWVSVSILVVCAVAFLFTWVLPQSPLGGGEEQLREMIEWWQEHPNVTPPAVLVERLKPEAQEKLRQLQAEAVRELGQPDTLDQVHMDELAARFIQVTEAAKEQSLLYRYALVPQRGAAQWGWLTSIFLHFGWLHLLFNLFFLYLVGLMLEDVWGRPLFAAFYLLGGLFAALAHAALEPLSDVPMAGASGAIAAAMGAFAFRFATKKIRMGYIILLVWRGTFRVPAWLAGVVWLGMELRSLLSGEHGGVAVMAHVGGFLFGLGTALVMKVARVEEHYLTPALTKKTGNFVRPPGLDVAAKALEAGEWERAREALEQVLEDWPENVEAELMLYQLEQREGRALAGQRLERVFLRLVTQRRRDSALAALLELGEHFNPALLRPATAFNLAELLGQGEEVPRELLERLYAVASKLGGPLGARALLRQAELAWEAKQVQSALTHLHALERIQGAPAEVAQQAARLKEELEARASLLLAQRSGGLTLEETPAAEPESLGGVEFDPSRPAVAPEPEPARQPPRFITGSTVVGASAAGLTLQGERGERQQVAFSRIAAVAAGLVPVSAPGQPARQQPVTDLVLSWGDERQGPQVLRLGLGQLGLGVLFPGVNPRDAYARWLRAVLDRSQAMALPEGEALRRGDYPRYRSQEEMDQALYEGAHA